MTSVGGRAPPARKTPRPSARSHWHAGVRGPHAPAPSAEPVLLCSAPDDGRYHARPAGPSGGASPTCTRSSPPLTGSPPTASRADVRGRTPTGPPALEPPVSTSSVFPWTPSSQEMEPLGNPGRFRWLWATFLAAPSSVADGLRWPRGGTHERRMAMSIDEPRARAPKRGLPIAERLLRRFTDAAREAQMSTQRATNEALKAWMASRPAEEQRGVALKASLRALAASEKQKRLTRRAEPQGPAGPSKRALLRTRQAL